MTIWPQNNQRCYNCVKTHIICHKHCTMLSLLNKISLQEEWQCFKKKIILNQQLKSHKTSKYKQPCRFHELRPWPCAPQSEFLPIDHETTEQIACSQSVSTLCIET